MPQNRSHLVKSLLLIGSLAVMWWLLPTAIKSFINTTFYEFQAPVWSAKATLDDLSYYWALRNHSKDELIEANQDLARLNAAYEIELMNNEQLRNENARLQEVLGLPARTDYSYEIARVQRREINTWWQTITINKGRDCNIPLGAAVVFSGGVAGRVQAVYAHSSVVELLSSRQFRVAAHFADDRRPVTFQGYVNPPFSLPRGEIRHVAPDLTCSVDAPRRLVSSDLGGTFPEGLTLGWMQQLEPSDDGLFQKGIVALDPRLLSITEVAILIPVAAAA